ncbi:MAG: hypothetical protein FWF75_05010 [Propionibacteriaceae bacterium]|nr:hypothetical protein [Propionibacteriaceae bacterium]
MTLARFMARPVGRGLRVVVGLVFIVVGIVLFVVHVAIPLGVVLVVLSVLLIGGGSANVCPLAVVTGGPFRGRDALSV